MKLLLFCFLFGLRFCFVFWAVCDQVCWASDASVSHYSSPTVLTRLPLWNILLHSKCWYCFPLSTMCFCHCSLRGSLFIILHVHFNLAPHLYYSFSVHYTLQCFGSFFTGFFWHLYFVLISFLALLFQPLLVECSAPATSRPLFAWNLIYYLCLVTGKYSHTYIHIYV